MPCSARPPGPPLQLSIFGVWILESIDVAAVIAALNRVLDARDSYSTSQDLAYALGAILAPVCTLESFSRVPVTRMHHAADPGYDPLNDVQILHDAIAVRSHLRARGVHVSREGVVPPEQFLSSKFVPDGNDARIDAAILSSLQHYI